MNDNEHTVLLVDDEENILHSLKRLLRKEEYRLFTASSSAEEANKSLHEKVLEQNEELKKINDDLEKMVQERTKELEIQNQALELSRAISEDLTFPIIGVSTEGLIAVINREAKSLSINGDSIEVGKEINEYFSPNAKEKMISTLETNAPQIIKNYKLSKGNYDINFTPLTGRFRGRGVILSLKQLEN